MAEYVLGGASFIDNIPHLLSAAQQAGATVRLLENAALFGQIDPARQPSVTCSEELTGNTPLVIPLTEFWVSQAIRKGVANISEAARRASRSKYYLSLRLAQCGLDVVPRCYLDEVAPPYPRQYLARLDTAYSGYGIVRHHEVGSFDAEEIERRVLRRTNQNMHAVMGGVAPKVVVEDYLEGEEYSVDVFVNQGQVTILRLFYKVITWIQGRPVCDSYIAVPLCPDMSNAIHDWCYALFTPQCTSFGQFDFIVYHDKIIPVDFSCRLGGGLDTMKRYARIPCYVAGALFGPPPAFPPFSVQKNLVAGSVGRIDRLALHFPPDYMVSLYKQCGDRVPENACSANARIAEVCFQAPSLQHAVASSKYIQNLWEIDVHA